MYFVITAQDLSSTLILVCFIMYRNKHFYFYLLYRLLLVCSFLLISWKWLFVFLGDVLLISSLPILFLFIMLAYSSLIFFVKPVRQRGLFISVWRTGRLWSFSLLLECAEPVMTNCKSHIFSFFPFHFIALHFMFFLGVG